MAPQASLLQSGNSGPGIVHIVAQSRDGGGDYA
jgi:hypothetical protein